MQYFLTIPAFLYLSLHLAAPYLPGHLWGVDALAYQPELFVPFIVVSLLLLTAVTGDRLPVQINDAFARFPESGRLPALYALTALLVSVFLTQTHLLGDGGLLLRELALGAESPEDRAPLSLFLIQQLYTWVGDALTTYRLVSLTSGIGFVWLALKIGQSLATEEGSGLGITALLITQGYSLLFAGYVETYSLLFAASALYIYVAVRCLKGEVGLLVPALVLSAVICVHVAAVSLVPSFVALLYVRREWGNRGALGSLGVLPVAVIGLLVLLDYPFSGGGEDLLVSQHLLPLWSTRDLTVGYALLDASHVSDLVNALLLAAPAFLVGLPLVIVREAWDVRDLWFATLCVPPLLMTWVINPEIGAFRDWDVLAYPALFLTVALCRWLSNPEGLP